MCGQLLAQLACSMVLAALTFDTMRLARAHMHTTNAPQPLHQPMLPPSQPPPHTHAHTPEKKGTPWPDVLRAWLVAMLRSVTVWLFMSTTLLCVCMCEEAVAAQSDNAKRVATLGGCGWRARVLLVCNHSQATVSKHISPVRASASAGHVPLSLCNVAANLPGTPGSACCVLLATT